jgi:hypothetical protein
VRESDPFGDMSFEPESTELEAFGDPGAMEAWGESFDDELGEAEGGSEWEELEGAGYEPEDFEGDPFFKGFGKALAGLARRVAPILKTVAPMAVNAVAPGLGSLVGESEGDFEDFEDDFEDEDGFDEEGFDGLSREAEILAEALAAEAASVESDGEAESLVGGITIHIVAPAPFAVKRISPILVRRSARLARVLRRSRRSRPLVRAIPTITRRTVAALSKRARSGKPVTRKIAAATLARQTRKVLTSPKRTARALTHNRGRQTTLKRLDRRRVMRAERFD